MKKPGNLTSYTNIIIYLAVAVLIVASYYLFIYSPLLEAEEEIKGEVVSLRGEVSALEEELDDVDGLQAEIDSLEEELSELLEVDLYDKETAMYILETKVRQADLRLRSKTAEEAADNYSYILSLAGDYKSFYDFMSLLAAADFRYQVDNFHLTPYEDELHMLININFYQWEILEQFFKNESGR